MPATHFSLGAATAGLLPDTRRTLTYPKDSPYPRIVLQQLRPAGFKIRIATLDDMPALVRLESFWKSDDLSADEATLRKRLTAFPTGQYVVETGPGGEILAAMYTQRVASLAVLRKAVRRTEASLQTRGGAVIQLLGVVARPSAGSLGGVLRSFVLRQAQLAGVQSVCGVTRCREWTGEETYADYVEKRSDRGLRFHLNAGAPMRGLVAGYRPEDKANEGSGAD